MRFHGFLSASKCSSSKLCFATDDEADLDLAFRPLLLSGSFSTHFPYDQVVSIMTQELGELSDKSSASDDERNQKVLITTLRDPGSYAVKWYRNRMTWDRDVGGMADATFAEWINLAPWRMNYITRMLGAQPDRKSVPRTYFSHGDSDGEETFLQDAYMKGQNQLGPEDSEVFQLALDRLKNDFDHFGLFHRLQDSWDLLSYRFCWNIGERKVLDGKDLRGCEAVEQLYTDDDGTRASEVWSIVRERNQLDIALLEIADKIMDERLVRMQAEKANGVLCNFLGKVKVTCDTQNMVPVEEL